MSSEVAICNIALSRIGAYPIANFTDASKEARECNTLYTYIRDSVLRDHKWSFATKRTILAELNETCSGYDYVYAYPSDCLVAHEIYNDTGDLSGVAYDYTTDTYYPTGKIEFEVASSSTLTNKIILSNKEAAELIYTARITDTNMYDTIFIDAFAYRLAAELAITIKGSGQLTQSLYQLYMNRIGQAKAVSANEGFRKPDNNNTFTNSRL